MNLSFIANDLDPRRIVEVELDSLETADSPRTAGESPEHVKLLAMVPDELPPIVVHRPTMRVIDGMHRLLAARLRGDRTIAARFFEGEEPDAFVLAVELNVAHGLPLSLADRKKAAQRIITTHPQWSDRMIASVTSVSAKTVAEIRRSGGSGAAHHRSRVGKDGRVRSLDGAVGRRRAYEIIIRDPDLSLRQIARAAGISPETARDVRNRYSRGEGPVPGAHDHAPSASRGTAVLSRVRRPTSKPPAVIVERLKADPALRLSENGRDLLRLLNIHTLKKEDWSKIVDSVPPHYRGVVAQLARECSEIWTEFALRIENRVPTAS